MTDGPQQPPSPPDNKPPGTAKQLLIIGYGNSLRQDDGAGLVLAAALAYELSRAHQQHRVQLCQVHQLMPELADTIADPHVGRVLFIDAVLAPSPSNTGAYWLVRINIDQPHSTTTGHWTTPQILLLYARMLGAEPPAWLLTVPAYHLDHGEGLSPGAVESCANVLHDAHTLWEQIWSPANDASNTLPHL